MKKKLLCILLAMILCMSVVLASCDKEEKTDPLTEESTEAPTKSDDKTPEAPKVDIAKGKETVVNYLKEDGQGLTEDLPYLDALVTEIEQMAFSYSFTVTSAEEEMEISLAMKDGLLYMSAGGEEKFLLLQNLDVKSFSKNDRGVWALDIEEPEEEVPEENPEDDSSMDSELLLMMLAGVDFAEITASDISYKNGQFIVKNEFFAEMMVASMMEGLIGDAELTPEKQAELDEVIAEAKAEFQNMLDLMKFQVAFRLDGTTLTQLGISIDIDAEAMREMETLDENTDGYMKMELWINLSDRESIVVKMDCYEENEIDMFLEFEIEKESETKYTISGNASVEDFSTEEKIEGTVLGECLMNDASAFPTKIPTIVQSYMK